MAKVYRFPDYMRGVGYVQFLGNGMFQVLKWTTKRASNGNVVRFRTREA